MPCLSQNVGTPYLIDGLILGISGFFKQYLVLITALRSTPVLTIPWMVNTSLTLTVSKVVAVTLSSGAEPAGGSLSTSTHGPLASAKRDVVSSVGPAFRTTGNRHRGRSTLDQISISATYATGPCDRLSPSGFARRCAQV